MEFGDAWVWSLLAGPDSAGLTLRVTGSSYWLLRGVVGHGIVVPVMPRAAGYDLLSCPRLLFCAHRWTW